MDYSKLSPYWTACANFTVDWSWRSEYLAKNKILNPKLTSDNPSDLEEKRHLFSLQHQAMLPLKICICIYPTSCDTRSIFKRSLTGFISTFSFSLIGYYTKAKELSLYNYLAVGRIVEYIPFPSVEVLLEKEKAWYGLWRVTVPFSYNDNHYTTTAYV